MTFVSAVEGRGDDGVDDVGSEERILRRVLPEWHPAVVKRGNPPPHWTDFKPTRDDADGLSVDRRILVVDLETAARSEEGQRRSLAELSVRDLHVLKLSVKATPSRENRAHATIPEVNYRDYSKGGEHKERIKELALGLASSANIVYEAVSA